MKLEKKTIYEFIKASEELPPTLHIVTIKDKAGLIYQDSANSWDKRITDYEWLKPVKDVYVLTELELKILLEDYKKSLLGQENIFHPIIEEFIQSLTK